MLGHQQHYDCDSVLGTLCMKEHIRIQGTVVVKCFVTARSLQQCRCLHSSTHMQWEESGFKDVTHSRATVVLQRCKMDALILIGNLHSAFQMAQRWGFDDSAGSKMSFNSSAYWRTDCFGICNFRNHLLAFCRLRSWAHGEVRSESSQHW